MNYRGRHKLRNDVIWLVSVAVYSLKMRNIWIRIGISLVWVVKWIMDLALYSLRPFQWHTATNHRVSLVSMDSTQHQLEKHVDQWLQCVVDFVLIAVVVVNVSNVISSLVVALFVEVLFQNVVHCSFLSTNLYYERTLKMVFLNLMELKWAQKNTENIYRKEEEEEKKKQSGRRKWK